MNTHLEQIEPGAFVQTKVRNLSRREQLLQKFIIRSSERVKRSQWC